MPRKRVFKVSDVNHNFQLPLSDEAKINDFWGLSDKLGKRRYSRWPSHLTYEPKRFCVRRMILTALREYHTPLES